MIRNSFKDLTFNSRVFVGIMLPESRMMNYLLTHFQARLGVKRSAVSNYVRITSLVLGKLGYAVGLPLSNAFGGSKDIG